MQTLNVKIITVKSLALEMQASIVILPGADGELGVLPGHIPMIVALQPGNVKVTLQDREIQYFVYDAIAEITRESVNILADFAVDIVTVSKMQILKQIEQLENDLAKQLDEHNITAIRANLDKQQALLNNI